jgi:UDP-N-acetylmuramate-alanine ligase
LKAAIQTAKQYTSDTKTFRYLQPQLYTRTRDFADDLRVPRLLDEIILLELLPQEKNPLRSNAQMLLKKLKTCQGILDKNELIPYLKSIHPNLLLVLAQEISTDYRKKKNSYLPMNK